MKYAEIQNKPCPIAPCEPAAPVAAMETPTVVEQIEKLALAPKHAMLAEIALPAAKTSMRVLKQSCSLDLQGLVCVFHVDTSSNIVEMREGGSGVVTGILDAGDIPAFVRELQEIMQMIKGWEG